MRRSQPKKKGKRERTGLQPIRNTGKRVRRNEPCPCGSGKKAKNCCLPKIRAWESIPPEKRGEFAARMILGDLEMRQQTVTEKTVADITQADQAAAEVKQASVQAEPDFQTNVGAAVEMMKGEVK